MSVDERLMSDRFPRASGYHPEWVLAGVGGGANPLWLRPGGGPPAGRSAAVRPVPVRSRGVREEAVAPRVTQEENRLEPS